MGGPTITTARDTSSSSDFHSSLVAIPTEEEEGNNDDIIKNRGRVAVGGMANRKKKMEEEEREKKEDFVKAVDDLLELVTKKFSRISRDMLGKSTSTTPAFITSLIFFSLPPGCWGIFFFFLKKIYFLPCCFSFSRKLIFIFFFVDGLVDEMTIRLDELEELVKKGPPGNEGRGPRIGFEAGVVVGGTL